MVLFPVITLVFLTGIFFNVHFFWCHWLGFAGLWFLYQKNRKNFLKGFLIPCWLVFFIVYAAYLFWLLRYEFWVYFLGTLTLSLIFPFFFFIYHFITRNLRPSILNIIAAFGIFSVFEFGLSRVPLTGTAAIDFFFCMPITLLRVTRFIDFKVWNAWIMATCFIAGGLIYWRSRKMLVLLAASLLAMGIFIGLANTHLPIPTLRQPVKIALIQHNLPFSEEWRIDHFSEVKQKYETLALKAAKENPDLIIFPQYTFPGDIYRDPAFFTELAKKTGAYILVATHVPAEAGRSVFDFGFINLALLFTPEGELGGVYQAMQEAPFGEIKQKSAKTYEVIETPFAKLGILLCYEDVTSQTAKEAVRAGADILISLSNPGMFLGTHMPYYHLQQDQLRAGETGLPLLRVSPNGYSAFIDKTGQIIQSALLNTENILLINGQEL